MITPDPEEVFRVIEWLGQNNMTSLSISFLSRRVDALERNNESLRADLKALNVHLEKARDAYVRLEARLEKLHGART